MSNGIPYIDSTTGDFVFTNPEGDGYYVIVSKDPNRRPQMAGDLSGTAYNQTVSKIKGIDSPDPTDAANAKLVSINSLDITPSDYIESPAVIINDDNYIYIGQSSYNSVWTSYESVLRVKVSAEDPTIMESSEKLDLSSYNFKVWKIYQDDDNLYCVSADSPDVVIISKNTFSVVGWGYVGSETNAVDCCIDGYGNLYVACENYDSIEDKTYVYIRKLVISNCIGKNKGAQLYSVSSTIFETAGNVYSVKFLIITYGSDSLWISPDNENIKKVNVSDITIVTDTFSIVDKFGTMKYAYGSLWVKSTNYAYRLNPADHSEIAKITNSTPEAVAISEAVVTGMNLLIISCMGRVSLIDVSTNTVMMTFDPRNPSDSGSFGDYYNSIIIGNVGYTITPIYYNRGSSSVPGIWYTDLMTQSAGELKQTPIYSMRQKYSAISGDLQGPISDVKVSKIQDVTIESLSASPIYGVFQLKYDNIFENVRCICYDDDTKKIWLSATKLGGIGIPNSHTLFSFDTQTQLISVYALSGGVFNNIDSITSLKILNNKIYATISSDDYSIVVMDKTTLEITGLGKLSSEIGISNNAFEMVFDESGYLYVYGESGLFAFFVSSFDTLDPGSILVGQNIDTNYSSTRVNSLCYHNNFIYISCQDDIVRKFQSGGSGGPAVSEYFESSGIKSIAIYGDGIFLTTYNSLVKLDHSTMTYIYDVPFSNLSSELAKYSEIILKSDGTANYLYSHDAKLLCSIDINTEPSSISIIDTKIGDMIASFLPIIIGPESVAFALIRNTKIQNNYLTYFGTKVIT